MSTPFTDDDIANQVLRVIAQLAPARAAISATATLGQLGLDSLETAQLGVDIATEFELGLFTIEPDWSPRATVAEVITDTINAIRGTS